MQFVVVQGTQFVEVTEQELFDHLGLKVREVRGSPNEMLLTNVCAMSPVVVEDNGRRLPISVTRIMRVQDLIQFGGVFIRSIARHTAAAVSRLSPPTADGFA